MQKKYPRMTRVAEVFVAFIVVYWLFSWYYSSIQDQIDKLNRDKVQWDNNEMFKKYLKDFNKSYPTDLEYERRKETFINNFKISRY